MNRAQKRQQAAEVKRKRKFAASPKAMADYAARARLWARGATLTGRQIGDALEGEWTFAPTVPHYKHRDVADYATHTPLRWHIVARCICRKPDGDDYVMESEAECGQAQKINELRGVRDELMTECHKKVNTKHIWDEVYIMRVL